MNKIPLIIKREFLTRVKKRSFIIMTLLGPILLAGFLVLAIWLGLSEEGKQKVMVVDPHEVVTNELNSTEDVQFFYTKEDLSNKDFESSPYDLLLYIHEKALEVSAVELYYKKTPSFFTQNHIRGQLEETFENFKLTKNQISREEYEKIKTFISLKTIDIETGEEDKYKRELAFVGFFFAIMIYMFIFMYGVQVMRGVIEEKTNRIVEVIISSVKPFQLMMGKIIGVAMVGLTQFILWILLTLGLSLGGQMILFQDSYDADEVVEQTQMTKQAQKEKEKRGIEDSKNYIFDLLSRINFPLMLGSFLFFFLGGYLLYSSLFAAVGSAVDSESDTQQFMMPITIPLIFGFIVAEMALQNPEGPAAVWFSIIPFTSPVVMMVRVAMGFDSGNIWQLYLSMLLLIGGFIFTTWLAGRIYRTGILMYGKKVNYRELWKWLTYKG